jgi:hypothetical protein
MEVTGQLHCPAERIFLREVRPWYLLKVKLGGHQSHSWRGGKESETDTVLSRVLVTRQVINGLSGLMNRLIGQSPGGSTNTYNTSKGYWNNNTQSLQHCHSLYEFGEQVCVPNLLSCLVLGLRFYSVGLSSISLLLVSSLDLSSLHADRIWNTPCNGTLHLCCCHRNVSFVAVWIILPSRSIGNVSARFA